VSAGVAHVTEACQASTSSRKSSSHHSCNGKSSAALKTEELRATDCINKSTAVLSWSVKGRPSPLHLPDLEGEAAHPCLVKTSQHQVSKWGTTKRYSCRKPARILVTAARSLVDGLVLSPGTGLTTEMLARQNATDRRFSGCVAAIEGRDFEPVS
jgi:hypothetical protein